MAESSMARAQIEIAKPVAVVRAQFFDVAHAIELQPYHGVKLSWAPPPEAGSEPQRGARLVRQELLVLGQAIVDDCAVEEGPEGTWVKRFALGANAGARYVARFEAVGDLATRVDLEAYPPPHGFNLGLGKLSALGLEKTLKKILAEHQKAIESYEFEPGSTRASVGSVLAALEDLTAPITKLGDRERRAIVATLLEAASVVAVADDEADAAEREVMDEVARVLCNQELDDDLRERLVKGAERALGSEGMAQRCERLGQRLKKLGCVELGLTVATIVAEVSHGIDPPELAALQKIALAAGLPEAALSSILSRVDEEMADALPLVAKRATAKSAPPEPARSKQKSGPPPLPPAAKANKP